MPRSKGRPVAGLARADASATNCGISINSTTWAGKIVVYVSGLQSELCLLWKYPQAISNSCKNFLNKNLVQLLNQLTTFCEDAVCFYVLTQYSRHP